MKLEKIVMIKLHWLNQIILALLPETLQNKLKDYCYRTLYWKYHCICGGIIKAFGNEDNYEVICMKCEYLYDED